MTTLDAGLQRQLEELAHFIFGDHVQRALLLPHSPALLQNVQKRPRGGVVRHNVLYLVVDAEGPGYFLRPFAW